MQSLSLSIEVESRTDYYLINFNNFESIFLHFRAFSLRFSPQKLLNFSFLTFFTSFQIKFARKTKKFDLKSTRPHFYATDFHETRDKSDHFE